MRLFIALDVPTAWRSAAADATAALARSAPDVLRAVDPHLMHLTLRFLGEVDPDAVQALGAALDARVPPVDVTLRLGAAGTFGPPARASVAWLGIGGDRDGLAALARRVEEAVVAAGLPADDRPYRPHLTLARVDRRAVAADRRAVAAAAAALSAPDVEPFRAREVVLVHSRPGGPRPRYTTLSRHG